MADEGAGKAWYKHWWGVILALCMWPVFLLWILWRGSNHAAFRTKFIGTVGVVLIAVVSLSVLATTANLQTSNVNLSTDSGQTTTTTTQPTNQSTPHVKAASVTTTTDTETQPIPFTTQNQNDASLPKGQTKVIQSGVNGVKTLTYKVTTTNGVQTAKTLTASVVTAQPVNQITAIGTYVAPAPTPTPTPTPQPVAPTQSCYPLTNGGNCYEPGEYCRTTDRGASGVAGDGESITCAYNNGWRWEPN